MGLLSKLKSMLGLGAEESNQGSTVDVTVERESAGTGESVGTDGSNAVDEPVTSTTDSDASTESLVEEHVEEGEKTSPAERAEPAEASAAEPGEANERTDVEEVDPREDEEDVPPSEGEEDVEILKGIGPSYAERLESAGVTTVADLAAADAEELAAEIDLSEKRVGRWIDRANERLESHD